MGITDIYNEITNMDVSYIHINHVNYAGTVRWVFSIYKEYLSDPYYLISYFGCTGYNLRALEVLYMSHLDYVCRIRCLFYDPYFLLLFFYFIIKETEIYIIKRLYPNCILLHEVLYFFTLTVIYMVVNVPYAAILNFDIIFAVYFLCCEVKGVYLHSVYRYAKEEKVYLPYWFYI